MTTERGELDRRHLTERVLDATPDHGSVVGRDYVYRYVHPAYEAAHGRAAADLVGLSVADLLGPAVFERLVRPLLDRALAGEEIAYEAFFDFTAKGRRCMAVRYLPLRDRAGEVDGVMVLAHDVTERKAAEEALRESEARYRHYVEHAPHGIFVVDGRGRYVEMNRAACQLTGFTEAELLGMSITELVPAELTIAVKRALARPPAPERAGPGPSR